MLLLIDGEKTMSVHLQIHNPNLPTRRVGVSFANGKQTGNCAGCGKLITYSDQCDGTVMDVACNDTCAREAGWFDFVTKEVAAMSHQPSTLASKYVPKTPPKCEKCGGERRGRGFNHKDDCPLTPANIVRQKSIEKRALRAKCEKCGGERRGKGFSHKTDCPLSTVNIIKQRSFDNRASRGNCPECGGPPGKRRGWQHTSLCQKNATAHEERLAKLRRKLPAGAE